MLETLKSSTEPKEDIENAKKYLVGIIARLKKKKKIKAAQALQLNSNTNMPEMSPQRQTFGAPQTMSKGPPYANPYTNDVEMTDENMVTAPYNNNNNNPRPPPMNGYSMNGYNQIT